MSTPSPFSIEHTPSTVSIIIIRTIRCICGSSLARIEACLGCGFGLTCTMLPNAGAPSAESLAWVRRQLPPKCHACNVPMKPQFVHWSCNRVHSLERRPIFQTLARSDFWPKCTDCQVRMTPLVIQWDCDYCLQIVTAELDTRAQEMAADEIQAEDTGVKGFNGRGGPSASGPLLAASSAPGLEPECAPNV